MPSKCKPLHMTLPSQCQPARCCSSGFVVVVAAAAAAAAGVAVVIVVVVVGVVVVVVVVVAVGVVVNCCSCSCSCCGCCCSPARNTTYFVLAHVNPLLCATSCQVQAYQPSPSS